LLKYLFFILFGLSSVTSWSQDLTGRIYYLDENGEKAPFPKASVYFSGKTHETTSNVDGAFSIKVGLLPSYLVASFPGFAPDSVLITDQSYVELLLQEEVQLSESKISASQPGTFLSKFTVLKTEEITSAGLTKLACCNLAESFENSATVTVGFTDAISGAKQVQLLGLSGMYSQMLAENIPTMRGLAATYGWSYTPGPWLESIQISKGASSVINGYESVSGQINLEFKKPNNTESLFVNLFVDNAERYEGNITSAVKINDKLSAGLLLHASTEASEHDYNKDGFLDQPKTKLVNLYNRWFYINHDKNIESRTGLKFLYETRESGQLSNLVNRYGTNIENQSFTVYNKTGLFVGDKVNQSIGIINSFTHHEQDSEFGLKKYKGIQNTMYTNVLYSSYIKHTAHLYTVGVSFLYDQYRTDYEDRLSFNQTPYTALNREEIVPGAFAQYTYSPFNKFMFILGFRGDYNNHFGWLATPRANIRYNIIDDIVFRASVGKGYRSPNVIAENIGLMASSRNFEIASINSLDIERAWNYGANIAFYIPTWDGKKLTLSLDYFRTDFQNQAIVDMERDRNHVFFYNLNGKSFANAWQADLSFNPFKGFDVFAAFRYNHTEITLHDANGSYQVERPLTSRYRGLINLSYATRLKKWVFDATAQMNGPSRIPSLTGYSQKTEMSPAFPIYFAQITKNTKRFDVYLGVENIFDYRQENPIIDSQNPFGMNFDSSLIWGPLMGRKFYAGIRLRIGNL